MGKCGMMPEAAIGVSTRAEFAAVSAGRPRAL
jgi:hypothetical protein